MVFPSVRSHLAALLLGAALLAPVMAQTVLRLPAATAVPAADLRHALAVAPGQALRLEHLPLGAPGAELASAELRRTNAGDTAALLIVHSGSEVTQTRPAPRAHFTGQLVGDPQSSVFVSIDSQGAMRSIVRRGEEVFVSDMPAFNAAGSVGVPGAASRQSAALRSRRVEPASDAPAKPFACAVDGQFIEKNYAAPSATLLQNLRNNHARAALLGAAPGPQRRADIIIETDYELFQTLGSSNAVHAYVTDLLGYASSQYESEIGVRLNLTQIHVYTSPADPWTGSATDVLLDQLQAYWNAPGRSSQARHHVHLLSGRDTGGGVAYVDTLGSASKNYAYGVSGSISGNFSASNPQVIWDSVAIAHEIGHAFGSDHTHNYDDPYIGSSEGGAIDCCHADFAGSQCAARYGVLPGIGSTAGGSASTGAGTIMSYCHLLRGNMSNLSFNFGTNHTRGVNPWRVASVLQSSAQTHLPLDSVVQNFALSVSRLGSGSGAISSTPAGIACSTSCSANFAAGTQVTLAAQPAAGSSFAGWSGACSGTASSCSVSMDSARSVTASFTAAPTQRLVTLTKSGTGSVTSSPSGLSCAADCTLASSSFASSSAVTLVPQAAAGSSFAGWSGACSGTGKCTIAADTSSASVTASFNATTTTNTNTNTNTNPSSSGTGPLPDPVDFVTQQYQDFLGRAPDSAGLAYWVGQINSGATMRVQLIASFMNSGEFRGRFGPLVRLYTAYFQRLPDYQGLMYWFDRMYPGSGTGASLTQVSNAFAQSSEFVATYGPLDNAGFITRIYQNVLGRAPDAAGYAYWLGQLNAGMPRGQVMTGFSESVENQNATANSLLITMGYVGMLRRTPDPAGHAWWLTEVNAGRASVLGLITGFLSSPEYAKRF